MSQSTASKIRYANRLNDVVIRIVSYDDVESQRVARPTNMESLSSPTGSAGTVLYSPNPLTKCVEKQAFKPNNELSDIRVTTIDVELHSKKSLHCSAGIDTLRIQFKSNFTDIINCFTNSNLSKHQWLNKSTALVDMRFLTDSSKHPRYQQLVSSRQ